MVSSSSEGTSTYPVSDRHFICFVFFGKHEIDKVFEGHKISIHWVRRKRTRCCIENTIHNHVGESMISVFEEILPRDAIVAIWCARRERIC